MRLSRAHAKLISFWGHSMNRRQLLLQATFFTVAAATGSVFAGETAERNDDDRDDERPGRFAFPQGVASGDPKSGSIVFWTRCVRTEQAARPVRLVLEVSEDAAFRRLVARVRLVGHEGFDHTVRAKVTRLEANRIYHYRFVAGADASPVGRAKTAAHAGSAQTQLRFAWFTCQDWSVNHWGAMSLLAKEDLDFVVHLGDYIYETVGASFQTGRAEPAHGAITFPDGTTLPDGSRYATTLADYRTLYRTYRGDARLQAVHARFAMIATWDDHEFSDDCWQDHQTYTNANLQQTARRRAANQAWVEYMPVDFGDVSFDAANPVYDNLRIYRDFQFGSLVHLVMTDERLYRDDHVVPEAAIAAAQGHDPINGSDSIGARYFIQQPVLQGFEAAKTVALGRAPSILGEAQTQWWKNTLKSSKATWKVWGNELMLSRLWIDLRAAAPAPYNALYVVNGDAWDGFPSHRAELMGFLRDHAIRDVVALTGDLHAFQCGIVRDLPNAAGSQPVMVDFVAAGISSSSFYSYVKAGAAGTPLAALVATPAVFDGVLRAHNPDFAYVDHNAQGYASVVASPNSLVVTFNKMRPLNIDGSVPVDPLLKRTRITLIAGTTAPIVEDNV
jgi:alkaline phosphatase D